MAEDLKAARKYNGRSRVCAKCENRHYEFTGTCCAICSREFIRGFRMGVKWQKEREKEVEQ